MIDYKDFLKNSDKYFKAYKDRGGDILVKTAKAAHQKISKLAKSNQQHNLETLQAEINKANKLMPSLDAKEKAKKISELKKLSDKISKLKASARGQEAEIFSQVKNLPNLFLADVPVGSNAGTNKILKEVGKRPDLEKPKDYLSLGIDLGIIDVQRASKVSGSRFGYLKAGAVLLEYALVQYTFSRLLTDDFVPVAPPVIINKEFMEAMGYLAQGSEEEVYYLQKDNQYLVGTAEQAVGPYFANEILSESDLPKKFIAFSSCFRREAGSYGKDTKGIFRVHQFDKLEMFVFCRPEESEVQHQKLLNLQEALVSSLGIPYRVVQLCTGDLGVPSAKTYDIECWLPGQNQGKGEYRETHSTSNTTDYQSRALNTRFKAGNGKNEFVHLLNGTAFAIGRILIAIIENYQQTDGSVLVPKVLQPYMHGIEVIAKK